MLAAGVASAVLILFYKYVSTRFLLDFTPPLTLSAVIGAWSLHLSNRRYPILGRLTNLLIIVSVAVSAIVSLLLAMSGAMSRFDDLNPELYRYLQDLFSS